MQRFLLLSLLAALQALPATAAETTAFVNVNVVPMAAEVVIEQQTVVVRNGTIAAVGPVDDVPIPEDAIVVDGTDRYLMPGLAEMHAHVPDADSPEIGPVSPPPARCARLGPLWHSDPWPPAPSPSASSPSRSSSWIRLRCCACGRACP